MKDQIVGFACAGVAVVSFGTNFVPIKKFETGDGMFFQWILCSAIWIAGLIVNIIRDYPPFQPLAMLGGFLWCTGNVMTVPIVKTIGLSLGLLIWGMSNLVVGWTSGTFGILGPVKETVPRPELNYIGFALAIISMFIFVFIKSETQSRVGMNDGNGDNNEVDYIPVSSNNQVIPKQNTVSWVEMLSPLQRRVAGIGMSLLAGVFYGVNFNPPTYLEDHGGSSNGLDYVFSHFSGIYITSTFYFLVYCAFKKNKPDIYPQCILPGFVSGAFWALADICWFVANANLDLVVAFPLVTTGPGLVASMWGIFVFKEIRGTRNYLVLLAAFLVTFGAVTLITLSKILH